MKYDDYTEMGGSQESFLTTYWSLIEDIKSEDDRNRALIGLLLERYWKPVYCYLRRKGYDNEEAKDLTQDFFHEVVLGRNLIQKADRHKGRFRTFLLTTLNRHIINLQHEKNAHKRRPKGRLVSLDISDASGLSACVAALSPEEAFNFAWVSSLLEQAMEEVESHYREHGMMIHWQVFYDRVLQPALSGTIPPSLRDICEKYSVENTIKASNMVITVRRRLQSALQGHLRDTVTPNYQLHDELEEIKKLFPKIAQDWK